MAQRRLSPLLALAVAICLPRATAADVAVYADALGAGWANWSWSATVNLANASPVHGGSASIATTYNAGWAGLYLHVAPALDGAQFRAVRFCDPRRRRRRAAPAPHGVRRGRRLGTAPSR